jgi:2-polyprenyl-3-methyl-5-hydroxy-6-metoxy-1,4-benzoquinol methylase
MLDTLSIFQRLAISIIIIFCVHYICLVAVDRFISPVRRAPRIIREGFEGAGAAGSGAGADDIYAWLDNDKLYDTFYAKIYDQLAAHSTRLQMQIAECMARWKDIKPQSMSVLDLGCGTGLAAQIFASKGVRVTAIDKSDAMIEQAKTKLLESKLDDNAASIIEYRQGDMTLPNAAGAQEHTCATLFYFSVYYVEDKAELFKNIYSWIKPGGYMMVEVVNKYKFDPMLHAASPFVGFSLQKYTKDRINKSKITFNTFEYEADFLLLEEGEESEAAEFREIFTFKKDGVVRRQKHNFNMPEIKKIIREADSTGWTYKGFKDMLPMGFEYSYMLFFQRA